MSESSSFERMRVGIVIPACDEVECIETTIAELRRVLPWEPLKIAVGVNGSRDGTADLCRRLGVLTAETAKRGYGHGCMAAIRLLDAEEPEIDAYVFMAADGANDPRDVPVLLDKAAQGFDFVLGTRTTQRANLHVMKPSHFLANRFLGLWASVLSGFFYTDLGPLRLIRRGALEKMALRETTYGWTIEPQVLAPFLGLSVAEVPVSERRRQQGRQKVSGVTLRHTLCVGLAIMKAGWRTSRRCRGLKASKD
ncbi:MAG: glycosyltransferase family 2 protein [Pirellulaceae bacterium]|nr:glycosyltransferase family 2 protein [Pirellulaceae bacterium]